MNMSNWHNEVSPCQEYLNDSRRLPAVKPELVFYYPEFPPGRAGGQGWRGCYSEITKCKFI
jgi:hypothetical protein